MRLGARRFSNPDRLVTGLGSTHTRPTVLCPVRLHALDAVAPHRRTVFDAGLELHAVPGYEGHVAAHGVEDDGPRHTTQHLVVRVRVGTVGDVGTVPPGVSGQAFSAEGDLDGAARR